jgi:hypothetical protein
VKTRIVSDRGVAVLRAKPGATMIAIETEKAGEARAASVAAVKTVIEKNDAHQMRIAVVSFVFAWSDCAAH